jgi:hypothetical protein
MNKHSRFTSNGFKLAVMALALSGAGSAMAAPVPATANATSTIIAPINIQKMTDLVFGSIVPSASPGTVTLTPGGTRTAGAGAVLAGGTPTAALFNVTGEAGKTYTLTVTATALTSGANNMTLTPISDFTPSGVTVSNAAPGSLTGGAQSVYVGGLLAVGANQAAGNYTGSVTASVDYN